MLNCFKKRSPLVNDNGFRWIVIFALALMLLTSFVFIISYRLALVGQEEVAIPNVINKELAEALQDLQAKNLNSQITLRFTDNTLDAGRVIDQEPKAGFVLRGGRKVSLIVSRGVVSGIIPNFVGLNIEDARNQVSLMYAKMRPLMIVANPMMVVDEAPSGTILSQSPSPGTEISSLVELQFRVSAGKNRERQKPLANYVGLSYAQALKNLFENRISFCFTLDASLQGIEGYVLSQKPGEGEYLSSKGVLTLSMKAPKVDQGEKFVLITTSLPIYPVFVELQVCVEESNGHSYLLYSYYTRGGRISLPAVIKEGSCVNLLVFKKQVERLSF